MAVTGRTVWLIILSVITLFVISFTFWIYFLPEPEPGLSKKECEKARKDQPALNDDCTLIDENTYDSSVPSAAEFKLYLKDFKESSGSEPFCTPTWYRFVYVDSQTGNYGDMSKWLDGPIFAGGPTEGQCWPCQEGNADNNWTGCTDCGIPTSFNSCNFGQPRLYVSSIGLPAPPSLPDSQGNIYYANVHRYSGETPPLDTERGEIVGFLTPPSALDECTFIDGTGPCNDTGVVCGSCC